MHPSICFSSYEAVSRLVAQNSNHRKSVILYIVITLSVNVSPETQFHPNWVKVINNLTDIVLFTAVSHSGENTRTKSIVWRTSWEMAQTVSEFLVHSRISGSLCLVPEFSKTSYHERSHVEKVILTIQTKESLFELKSEVLASRKLIHDACVYFQARKILGVEKAVYFPGPDSQDLSQALEILNNQPFREEKMKFLICFLHSFLKKRNVLNKMKLHLETLLNSFEVGKWFAKFETYLSSFPVRNIFTESILAHQLLLSAQNHERFNWSLKHQADKKISLTGGI